MSGRVKKFLTLILCFVFLASIIFYNSFPVNFQVIVCHDYGIMYSYFLETIKLCSNLKRKGLTLKIRFFKNPLGKETSNIKIQFWEAFWFSSQNLQCCLTMQRQLCQKFNWQNGSRQITHIFFTKFERLHVWRNLTSLTPIQLHSGCCLRGVPCSHM